MSDLFPKLRTPENVRYMSKKSRFKGPFDTQHGLGSNRVAICYLPFGT